MAKVLCIVHHHLDVISAKALLDSSHCILSLPTSTFPFLPSDSFEVKEAFSVFIQSQKFKRVNASGGINSRGVNGD